MTSWDKNDENYVNVKSTLHGIDNNLKSDGVRQKKLYTTEFSTRLSTKWDQVRLAAPPTKYRNNARKTCLFCDYKKLSKLTDLPAPKQDFPLSTVTQRWIVWKATAIYYNLAKIRFKRTKLKPAISKIYLGTFYKVHRLSRDLKLMTSFWFLKVTVIFRCATPLRTNTNSSFNRH